MWNNNKYFLKIKQKGLNRKERKKDLKGGRGEKQQKGRKPTFTEQDEVHKDTRHQRAQTLPGEGVEKGRRKGDWERACGL